MIKLIQLGLLYLWHRLLGILIFCKSIFSILNILVCVGLLKLSLKVSLIRRQLINILFIKSVVLAIQTLCIILLWYNLLWLKPWINGMLSGLTHSTSFWDCGAAPLSWCVLPWKQRSIRINVFRLETTITLHVSSWPCQNGGHSLQKNPIGFFDFIASFWKVTN